MSDVATALRWRWLVVPGILLVAVAGGWLFRQLFGSGPPAPAACPNYTLLTQRLTGSSWDIFGLDPQTGVEANLTAMAGDDTTPAWNPAPDRANFAFVSRRDGNAEIYRLDCGELGATSLVRVTTHPDEDIDPAWSGDNRLAFASNRLRVDGQPRYTIFRSRDSGGELTQVSPNGACDARQPAWSPDGSSIAYAADCNSAGRYQIYVIPRNGGTPVQITDDPLLLAAQPTWSPDGSLIAFARYESGPEHARIWVMGPDGSGKRQLRPGSTDNEFDPRWTPDGSEVTFVMYTGGTNLDVYAFEPTLGADGNANGTLRQVTSSSRDDRAPDWVR
ncbi:MAG: PD40 domain-containing protein [Pseudomonadales bacterium]|nr:PD40 domain-containing protein [Pseudomonadales bacterium]